MLWSIAAMLLAVPISSSFFISLVAWVLVIGFLISARYATQSPQAVSMPLSVAVCDPIPTPRYRTFEETHFPHPDSHTGT